MRSAGTVQQTTVAVSDELVAPLLDRLETHLEALRDRRDTPPVHNKEMTHPPALARRENLARVLSPSVENEPFSRAVIWSLAHSIARRIRPYRGPTIPFTGDNVSGRNTEPAPSGGIHTAPVAESALLCN